jgi:hypothetical protein
VLLIPFPNRIEGEKFMGKTELNGTEWLPEFGVSPISSFTEAILLECLLREFADDGIVGPRLPPHDLRPGYASGPIMLWWVDMGAAKNVGMDVAVAVSVYEITHSGGTAAAIAVLRKLHSVLKHLSKEELEVIREMGKLSKGDIYNKRIPEGELLRSWPGDSSKLPDLLDQMERKNYLVHHRDGWTVQK